MLNIVYYTSGLTGSGRIVRGISIGNALVRKNIDCKFVIVSSCRFGNLAERCGFRHIEIPYENENQLSQNHYRESVLYSSLMELKPDILIVDLQWFSISAFIETLDCRKVFLCTQLNIPSIDKIYFTISLEDQILRFNPKQYDLLVEAEPTNVNIPMIKINPLIIRNREEILPKEEALKRLGVKEAEKNCLFAFNGNPGEFEEKKKIYSYLEEEGYTFVYTTNYKQGLFPAADYFNAFDLLIIGAGYNAFWEAVYFEKEAIFCPIERRFESQRFRTETCQDYIFRENGADQLVELLIEL